MPSLPRSPDEVQVTPAGTWPGPDARRAEPWTGPNLLPNGSFEEGFEGWSGGTGPVYALTEGNAADGGRSLAVRVDGPRHDLRRQLSGLQAGTPYVLVYHSRGNTLGDFRVIVRNLANAHYIANGPPSATRRWRRTVLRFTAPDADVSLELSPRTSGQCDLDGFLLFGRHAQLLTDGLVAQQHRDGVGNQRVDVIERPGPRLGPRPHLTGQHQAEAQHDRGCTKYALAW